MPYISSGAVFARIAGTTPVKRRATDSLRAGKKGAIQVVSPPLLFWPGLSEECRTLHHGRMSVNTGCAKKLSEPVKSSGKYMIYPILRREKALDSALRRARERHSPDGLAFKTP